MPVKRYKPTSPARRQYEMVSVDDLTGAKPQKKLLKGKMLNRVANHAALAAGEALPLVVSGFSHNEIGRRARAALDKVGLLAKERLYPIVLSGGEQQRVGIARAVVHRPRILLADEPTGNLDPDLSREIMSLFVQFNQIGVTVLVATHDVDLVHSFGYDVLCLRDGRFVDPDRTEH